MQNATQTPIFSSHNRPNTSRGVPFCGEFIVYLRLISDTALEATCGVPARPNRPELCSVNERCSPSSAPVNMRSLPSPSSTDTVCPDTEGFRFLPPIDHTILIPGLALRPRSRRWPRWYGLKLAEWFPTPRHPMAYLGILLHETMFLSWPKSRTIRLSLALPAVEVQYGMINQVIAGIH